MAKRQSVASQQAAVRLIREEILAKGTATRAQQVELLRLCRDDQACIDATLRWLLEDAHVPVRKIIPELKRTLGGRGQPRRPALEHVIGRSARIPV